MLPLVIGAKQAQIDIITLTQQENVYNTNT